MARQVLVGQRPRRWRKFVIAALIVLALVTLGVGFGVPWYLGSPAGRRWLNARASAALAPARLEVAGYQWSWFGPTRMTGFVLRDRQGDIVVNAPTAVWDRNLFQAWFDKPRYGTLDLKAAALDVERHQDGTVDLLEALRPILGQAPRSQFNIHVAEGTLRLRCPELLDPVEAEGLKLTIDRPTDPQPLTWDLHFKAKTPLAVGGERPWFDARGRIHKDQPVDADIDIALSSKGWPLAAPLAGGTLNARGKLTLNATVARRASQWQTSGDATLAGASVDGAALKGDQPRWDELKANWQVAHDGRGWWVDRLTLEGPGVNASAEGAFPVAHDKASLVRGRIDLPQLIAQLPHTIPLREGIRVEQGDIGFDLTGRRGLEDTAWHLNAHVGDLRARSGERMIQFDKPATVGIHLRERKSNVTVEQFHIDSALLKAKGRGDVDQGITLDGTIDLAALADPARSFLDLGDIDPRGKGTFEASYQRTGETYIGTLALNLNGLKLAPDNAASDRPRIIVPEDVHADLTLKGPADASGWPVGWRRLDGAIQSQALNAKLGAEADTQGVAVVEATVSPNFRKGDQTLPVEARLVARRDGESWAIEQARLSAGGQDEATGLQLAATGRFDPREATLELHPAPGSRALTMGPEGLKVLRIGRPDWEVEGQLIADAAGLETAATPWLDAWPRGLTGKFTLGGSWRAAAQGTHALTLAARSDDLARSDGTALAPFDAGMTAVYQGDSQLLDVQELKVANPYASLTGKGRVEQLLKQPTLDLDGSLAPNWDALNAYLSDRVDAAAHISGRPRAFHVRGPLDANAIDVEAGVELDGLDVYGMRIGSTPLVARWREGRPSINAIDTTLNGGRLVLKPDLTRAEAAGSPWVLRLGSESGVTGAEINDEVSHRVLAYVAPVLDRATRVNGRISARLDHVEIPINGDAAQRAVVEGTVVFQDVTFGPGPMAAQLYNALGMQPMTLRLDQPVVLSVAEGQVHQRGFSLPLGKVARVQMEGVVGFDRTLALNVSVPLAAEQFTDVPVFNRIAPNLRLEFPIRGTLSDPKIDGPAMREAMGRVGLDLAQGAGLGSIESLIRGLATPRDPEEVARQQAERAERQRIRREETQRKKEAQRLKREERKRQRELGKRG